MEDVTTPDWASSFQAVAKARFSVLARQVPRAAGVIVRASWTVSKALTVLAGVLQLISGVATTFGLLATAQMFTQLLAADTTPHRLINALPSIAVVVAMLATRALLEIAVSATAGVLAPLVEQQAKDQLHQAVIQVELMAFDDADFTDLVGQAEGEGSERLKNAVHDIGELVASLVALTASLVSVGILHPLLTPLVLLAVLPQGWASVRAGRLMFDSYVRTMSRRRRLGVTSSLITDRGSAAEIRAFTAQAVLIAEHRRIAADLTAEAVQLSNRRSRLVLLGRALSGAATGLAYVLLGLLVFGGLLPIALAGAAVVAMRTATGAVSRTVHEANNLYQASFAFHMYYACLDQAAARRRPSHQKLAGHRSIQPSVITLDNVTFHYPGQGQAAVHGVTTTLRRGQVVAVVGENGSGKSTLAKLITGLYLPDSGTVCWDGTDTRAINSEDLHEQVAIVLQDPLRWPMTAANNVRIGRLERYDPDGEIFTSATRQSGADLVVASLPHSWSTVLSRAFQSGHDLSGGQWQRMSVARGLYRDAPLMVADEPTSALDARAEHSVFTTLRALAGSDKITVLITHRLANIRHADHILVMEHGRLVQHGSHDQLMAAGGVYHDLFDVQARAYLG